MFEPQLLPGEPQVQSVTTLRLGNLANIEEQMTSNIGWPLFKLVTLDQQCKHQKIHQPRQQSPNPIQKSRHHFRIICLRNPHTKDETLSTIKSQEATYKQAHLITFWGIPNKLSFSCPTCDD